MIESRTKVHLLSDRQSGFEAGLLKRYRDVRALSLTLAEPLSEADQQIQSMPDASPAKWHLAHTTWFFETFILKAFNPSYQAYDSAYAYLFNSYYHGIGPQYRRAQRGVISRPAVSEIINYRGYVDAAMTELIGGLANCSEQMPAHVFDLIVLGLNHEQQHQELLLTDIKHALSLNPLFPTYKKLQQPMEQPLTPAELQWLVFDAGIYEVGHESESFCFDNEQPRHRVFLESFALASRLVCNAEYLDFIRDGGYQNPEFWLSEGWDWVQREQRRFPLYWHAQGEDLDPANLSEFSLAGLRPWRAAAPVSHVSFYEANAYANWSGARLPTEQEWETASHTADTAAGSLNLQQLAPSDACPKAQGLQQMFGSLWQWTGSAYGPYPGFKPPAGPVGEYNGKFMCNQMVLRGGSCATPAGHIRASYRNFFPAHACWQFSGIRLAKDKG